MKKILMLSLVAMVAYCCSTKPSGPRVIEDFNFDWKFTLDSCQNWQSVEFDDASWRSLHLPHDWSVEQEFSSDAPCGANGGALPGGVGLYRKHFITPSSDKVFVEFDGVYMLSTVYVNGKEVGTWPYGYSSFSYDITGYLNPAGQDNVIAVCCDNSRQPNSRWYSGSGIYRNVRLVAVNDIHVAYSGTYITTPEISENSARFDIQTTVENSGKGQAECAVSHTVKDAKGRTVGETSEALSLNSGENVSTCSVSIGRPHLWNIDDPYLYTVETTISVDGKIVDNYLTITGIRYMNWDVDKGFFLNGKSVKMLGVCLHHDMGCIGSAIHYRALERELQIMKDMGVNAIRTSHNPPAPELLQLADRMGFLVIDEAFDMWRKRKTTYDYSQFFDQWHVKDIEGYVKRDRNHPCVIMWSLANEIEEQGWGNNNTLEEFTPEQINLLINFVNEREGSDDPVKNNANVLLTRHLAKIVKDLDATRFVTAGNNWVSSKNNIMGSGALDAVGFNYCINCYDSSKVWFPGVPMYASETVSSLNSRGWYPQPSTKSAKKAGLTYESPDGTRQCTAYDRMAAPWGAFHEEGWIAVRDREHVAGTFIWTGFDYLGEPTPFYRWPSRSSYFGIVDLAGFPKDPYWMYQSEWTDKTILHVFPHWNWNAGDSVDVWCYYNKADEVELFVNGRSLGRKSKTSDILHTEWLSVPFEPGKIEVVSYKDGKEVARDSQCTTGKPAKLRLTADRSTIKADGYDLSYVTVEALDENGTVVPTADTQLHFSVAGAGELYGIDNGNPADTTCLKGTDKAMFGGKALAVVRSVKNEKGTAILTVSSEIGNCELRIKSK